MVTASDIIRKLISDAGYKNIETFANESKISCKALKKSLLNNIWTRQMLEKVGSGLGKDLSKLKTANLGREARKDMYNNE
jgi:hypothetical protein